MTGDWGGLQNAKFAFIACLFVTGLFCVCLETPATAMDCGSTPKPSRRESANTSNGPTDVAKAQKETGFEITLLDPKRKPIAQASVTLVNKRRRIHVAGLTDAQGFVHIDLPEPGRYAVRIVFPNRRQEVFWQILEAHEQVQLIFTYPPPTVVSPCDVEPLSSQVISSFSGRALPWPQASTPQHAPMR
ncbi:MAG TPA: carboxypeptidase-like regulatory domain-containing protein [Candidatus Angelobacter sp.]|jgi:hypothetical protein